MRVLHLLRRRGDELAYAAIRSHEGGDEVRVVLFGDAAGDLVPAGIDVYGAGPGAPGRVGLHMLEYDEIVALIEWSDKVVAW